MEIIKLRYVNTTFVSDWGMTRVLLVVVVTPSRILALPAAGDRILPPTLVSTTTPSSNRPSTLAVVDLTPRTRPPARPCTPAIIRPGAGHCLARPTLPAAAHNNKTTTKGRSPPHPPGPMVTHAFLCRALLAVDVSPAVCPPITLPWAVLAYPHRTTCR